MHGGDRMHGMERALQKGRRSVSFIINPHPRPPDSSTEIFSFPSRSNFGFIWLRKLRAPLKAGVRWASENYYTASPFE